VDVTFRFSIWHFRTRDYSTVCACLRQVPSTHFAKVISLRVFSRTDLNFRSRSSCCCVETTF